MLQQTTVNAVIPYYERWVRLFPDVHALSRAPETRVLKAWQGLGYYNRARNLHRAAKVIDKEFAGRVPDDKNALRQLPGFGPYTTGAVLSIAFGQRETIVDANVRRVVMRLEAIKGVASPQQDVRINGLLREILPRKNMSEFNQGLMELGALVCRNQNTLCLQCPLKLFCKAYRQGIQEIIPEKIKKRLVEKHVALAIIAKDQKVFIQQRSSRGLLAGFWEFPGGEKKRGERLSCALAREVREEIQVEVVTAKALPGVKHFYTKFCAHLHPFLCTVKPYPKVDKTHRWVSLAEFRKYPIPSGTARVIELLRKERCEDPADQ